jgi:hypothetical protein
VPNIDLGTILQNAVPFGYGDLVTRPTGRAVRSGVEEMLPQQDAGKTTVIDFSAVRCLDISCADEIVGKLLLQYGQGQYFVLSGVSEAHCESIDLVLERHCMAVVAQNRDGSLQVLGPVGEPVRKAFGAVQQSDCSAASDVADRLAISTEATLPLLAELLTLRLVTQEADQFRALSA